MVDQEDGQVEVSLEGAQVGQQCGDLHGGVFIEAVQADEGVQDQQTGPVCFNGCGQTGFVGLEVEAELFGEDEEDGQRGEVHAAGACEALQAIVDLWGRVLGGEQEDRPRIVNGEASQTGGTGSDRQGDFQGEVGFAALCRVPDYAA